MPRENIAIQDTYHNQQRPDILCVVPKIEDLDEVDLDELFQT